MVQRLIQFLNHHQILKPNSKILLGVSGGKDSMVMADLFLKSEIQFAIAHCNFSLRHEESDGDELLVHRYAEENNIEFFVRQFNTLEFASINKISIQMAARQMRIQYFEELCKNKSFEYFATAHHQDDAIETFFLNLIRGTGIAGLHGILPRQGISIHPMLFTNRDEIEAYAISNKIAYREDSSNAKTDYTRNKIRQHLLPVFNSINSSFAKIMEGNIDRLYLTEQVYKQKINETLDRLVVETESQILINKIALQQIDLPEIYLYEFLVKYDFNFSDVTQILESLDGISGKQFFSKSHRLVVDREFLLITKLNENTDEQINTTIQETDSYIYYPLELSIQHFIRTEDFVPDGNPKTAFLDADLLQFPLTIGKWRQGDFFIPLGMKGSKLLSDLFTDLKLSIPQKENVFVLKSFDHIVWVIGYRIDDRYKINPKTKNIVRITQV